MSDDDDGPEGYRTPARVRDDDDGFFDDLEAAADDSPVTRAANRLMLDALDPEGTMLRIEPEGSGQPVRRKHPGQRWEVVLEPPPEGLGAIARRLKVMAALSTSVSNEPDMGFIRLVLGPGREVDFCVFVRPCTGGERLVLRNVPQATRRAIFGGLQTPPELLAELRWRSEHAFRLARGKNPRSAIAPLRELHEACLAHGSSAALLEFDFASALARILSEEGDHESALEACVAARRAAERSHGEGPKVAAIMMQSARVLAKLERIDDAVALGLEAVAVARRVLVEDPFIAELEADVGDLLCGAGQREAAAERYDAAVRVLTELSGPDDAEIAALRGRLDA